MISAIVRSVALGCVVVAVCGLRSSSVVAQSPMIASGEQCMPGCPCVSKTNPRIGTSLVGGRAGEEIKEGWLTPEDDDEEDLTDPEDLDDVEDIGATTGTGVADGYQRLTLEFDPIVAPPAPPPQAPGRPLVWSIVVDFFTALRGPVLEASATPMFSTLIVSNGASQGEAFKLSIINHGRAALRIGGEGLVVEPLKSEASKAALRQLAKYSHGITNVKLNGFCLDERLLTPSAGMVFRIAPPRVQQQVGSMRSVLKAARTLRVTDALHPDSNADSYTDFIKQWSIWTKRERWSEQQFAAKLLEHTKKRFDADRRPWTAQVETALRAASPNRWRDIQSVLSLAGTQ